MQIDWITVAAQIANFLLLVWLLQRFLYQPITQAMKRREEKIEERLAEAKSAREDAASEAEELRRKQDKLEESRKDILEDARDEAKALREQLETDLREDMEGRRETWRKHLEEEHENLAKMLRRRAGHQVIAITQQVLMDYAQADLAGQVADGFIVRIEELNAEITEKLAEAAAHADDPAIVESSTDLKSGARGQITRAIHQALSTDIDVEYRKNEDLLLGIRLTIGEQTLEWSAERYLKRLDSALDEAIDSAAPAHSATPDAQGSAA